MSEFGVDPFGRPVGMGQPNRRTSRRRGEEDDERVGTAPQNHPNSPQNGGGAAVPPQPPPTNPPPQPNLSREEFKNQFLASGPMTADQFKARVAQLGGQFVEGSPGHVRIPGGDLLDIGFAYRAAEQGKGLVTPAWTPVFDPQNPQAFAGIQAQGRVAGGPASQQTFATQQQRVTLPNEQLGVYKPGTLNTFQAPDQSALENRNQQVIMDLLNRPTFDDATVSAIKERQKESAMKAAEDLLGQTGQRFSSLGRLDSGEALGAERDVRSRMISDILAGNRDIDIAAAEQNRGARERAVGLGEASLSGRLGRATSAFDTDLRRALAQEDLNFRGHQSDSDRIRFNLERALAQEGVNQGQFAQGLDARRLDELIRQFNADLNFRYGQETNNQNRFLIDRVLSF